MHFCAAKHSASAKQLRTSICEVLGIGSFWMRSQLLAALSAFMHLGAAAATTSSLCTADGRRSPAPSQGGLTPLHSAAEGGHDQVVSALLGHPSIAVNQTNAVSSMHAS